MIFKTRGDFVLTIDQANSYRCNLRQTGRNRLARASTTFFQKTVDFLGPKFFNILPDNIANSNSMCTSILIKSVKKGLLELTAPELELLKFLH